MFVTLFLLRLGWVGLARSGHGFAWRRPSGTGTSVNNCRIIEANGSVYYLEICASKYLIKQKYLGDGPLSNFPLYWRTGIKLPSFEPVFNYPLKKNWPGLLRWKFAQFHEPESNSPFTTGIKTPPLQIPYDHSVNTQICTTVFQIVFFSEIVYPHLPEVSKNIKWRYLSIFPKKKLKQQKTKIFVKTKN